MSREKRLGRGLEALLGQLNDAPPKPPTTANEAVAASLTSNPSTPGKTAPASPSEPSRIAISAIEKNPFQPRESFDEDELDALAASLKSHGLLQPLVVRRLGEGYQLVAGERRMRAAIKAGWSEVPIRLVEADDRQMAELAIIENMQRKDLNPLEKARSFQRYIDAYNCQQEELAARLKLDRSTVTNMIRLLDLPESIQTALRAGHITQGHARAMLPLSDEDQQLRVCRQIQSERLSVRQTEELVLEVMREDPSEAEHLAALETSIANAAASSTEKTTPASRTARTRLAQLASLEKEFRSALGTKVDLRQGSAERGKIVIHFRDHEEFDRLRDYLLGNQKPAKSAKRAG